MCIAVSDANDCEVYLKQPRPGSQVPKAPEIWECGGSLSRLRSFGDCVGDGDRPPRHLGVQALDHAAVDLQHPLVFVFRQIERGDDFARRFHLFRVRREGRIAGLDLARMNKGLAVETEVARLPAFRSESFRVAEVVVNAIENIESVGARGGDAIHQPRHHRRAAGNEMGARIFGEIVGAHHETGKPRL